MEDKKSIIYFAVFVVTAIIVAGVIYFVIRKDADTVFPLSDSEEMIKKIKIERQIKELDDLHQQTNPQPITQEDIDRQIEELDRLHLQVQ